MELHTDLHSHSGYAGGVGNTSLADIESNMPLKGIDVVGTGDCMHPLWRSQLESSLEETFEGLYTLQEQSPVSYLLQTEIIVTSDIGGRRKGVHTILLFPSFSAIEKVTGLCESWGMKNTVGRPFLKCRDSGDVSDKMHAIRSVDDMIEVIPAHVMTPEGVFGSKAPVDSLQDFYGEYSYEISAVETGLSSDPEILSLIPELDKMTLISNSDAHSPALHRMGREFTTLRSTRNYSSIIKAIRANNVEGTAEFNPTEGRYFLSGHRAGRAGHGDRYCVYSPSFTPSNRKCPICGKTLTIGVLERALELSAIQGDTRTREDMSAKVPFVHMVPLTEIIANALGIASPISKKVLSAYAAVTSRITESALWFSGNKAVESALSGIVDQRIIDSIITVKNGDFCFDPAGYDGVYGQLRVGSTIDVDNISFVSD